MEVSYYPNTEPGSPQFSRPVHSLEVSNDKLLYVSDRGNGRIQIFTIAGKYVKQLFINCKSDVVQAFRLR